MSSKRLLVLLCLAAAGCGVDNGSSIAVIGRVITPTITAGSACTFATGTFQIGPGLLDVQGALTYALPLEVDNNMLDPGTSGSGVTGAKTWSAQRVRTRVVGSSGFNPALVTVTSESTTPADSTSVLTGGKQVLYITAVGQELGTQIKAAAGSFAGRKSLQLGVTLLGKTGDGAELDTGEKTYPLELCDGCLVAQPICATGTTLAVAPSCFDAGQDQSYYACQTVAATK